MTDVFRFHSHARRAVVVLTGLGLALTGAANGAAAAAEAPALEPTTLTGLLLNIPGQHLAWTDDVTAPILPETELAPGETMSSVVGLRNETDGAVVVSLQVRDIEEDGQLGDHLRFTITRDPERDGTFEPTPVFAGPIGTLADGIALADGELPTRSAWDYRVEASLAEEAGNDVAGDEVSFSFVWKSTAVDGSSTELLTPAASTPDSGGTKSTGTDVMGHKEPEGGATLPVLGALPITGADLALLVGGGFGLLALGIGLRLIRRDAMSL